MSLTDNVFALKRRWPNIWERLTLVREQNQSDPIRIIESKNGEPTAAVTIDGNEQFIHSKYNPKSEGSRIIEGITNELEDDVHVLFYGAGLGYHIEQFVELHPKRSFSIYEPFPTMFHHFLSHGPFKKISGHISELYVDCMPDDRNANIHQFVQQVQSKVKLVVLPSYERIFRENVNQFTDAFKNALQLKTTQLQTNLGFEKLWTINSMQNFEYVLKTPNMIHQCKEYFKDKPVVLVAAGPSLDDEIENLRMIKEKV